MDAEIAILRLLHILPGAVWVGSAVFLAWAVQPALAKNRGTSCSSSNGEHAQAIDDCSARISNFDDRVRCDHGIACTRPVV